MRTGTKVAIIVALMVVAGVGTWAVMRGATGDGHITGTSAVQEASPAAPVQDVSLAALSSDESSMVDWYAEHVGRLGRLVDEEMGIMDGGYDVVDMRGDVAYIVPRYADLTNEWTDSLSWGLMGGQLALTEKLWLRTSKTIGEVAKIMADLESASDADMTRAADHLVRAVSDVGKLRAEIERLQEMQ